MRTLEKWFQTESFQALMAPLTQVDQDLVRRLVDREWAYFDAVHHVDGRAICQDEARSFSILRAIAYLVYSTETLRSIDRDFDEMDLAGRNPVAEKYAHMTRSTDPSLYQSTWADRLPTPSPIKEEKIRAIVQVFRAMLQRVQTANPEAYRQLRQKGESPQSVSSLTYLESELNTYSYRTLARVLHDVQRAEENKINLILEMTKLRNQCMAKS